MPSVAQRGAWAPSLAMNSAHSGVLGRHDTPIYYIVGDNGASAEGSLNGCFNEMGYMNGMPTIRAVAQESARTYCHI